MPAADDALLELGRWLTTRGYRFTTITPESHRRVNARPANAEARTIEDIFGWSRPFRPGVLPTEVIALLDAAGELRVRGDRLASGVRWSSLGDHLYVHGGYPTSEPDAVFFGPDTSRFVALLGSLAPRARRAVDVGCGSGAGGLAIAATCARLTLADINPRALALARVNAALAGVAVEVVKSDVLAGIDGDLDLVIANPPYLADPQRRVYRDGGGAHGSALSVRIVDEALARLAAGGRLILYGASAIVAGRDPLRAILEPRLAARGATWTYRELDPDVFGEELDGPAYAEVERIAVIALDALMPG